MVYFLVYFKNWNEVNEGARCESRRLRSTHALSRIELGFLRQIICHNCYSKYYIWYTHHIFKFDNLLKYLAILFRNVRLFFVVLFVLDFSWQFKLLAGLIQFFNHATNYLGKLDIIFSSGYKNPPRTNFSYLFGK